jgi:hypothetical protein
MINSSSTPRRLVLGGIAAAIVVAALVLLNTATGPDHPAPGDAKTAKVDPKPASSASQSGALPPMPQLPPMPDEIMARILKNDKKLGTFMEYHKAVLLDKKRREEYRKLLSSAEMMTAMAEDLMSPGSGHVDLEEYYHRLMEVDYFEAALGWKENPQRDKVLAVTRDIIVKDNFETGQDTARRQLLGGTKMELYRLMYKQDPEKATAMLEQSSGTRMEPLVSWMAGEEIRRRTREDEIRKETEAMQQKALQDTTN